MIKRVFPVIAVCVFAAQTGIAIISPIISIYANQLGTAADLQATALWVGLVYGAYSISRVFVMPLIGRLTDKHGRRIFVGGGLILSALISILYVYADTMPMLFAVRLIHGAVSAAIVPPARAWIAELSPSGQEGRWQGYFNTAFFSGAGAGPLLGGVLSDFFSMDVAFMAMGALNLMAFLLVATLLRESSERKMKDRPRVSFREIGRSRLFQGLFVQRMSKELSIACFIAFMPLYVSTRLDISLTVIGALLAGNLFLSSWLQILTGRVADRFDRRRMVLVGSYTSFVMMALIPFAANLWQLIALFFIRALGTSISMPGSAALYVGIGKKQGMGSTIALMGMATSIGLAAGPVLSGVVAQFTEIRAVFFFAAGLGFLGTTTFAILSSLEPSEPITPAKQVENDASDGLP